MFKEELKNYKEAIEKHIKNSFPKEELRQKILFESMNYSLTAGGKRIRPILFLKAVESLGKKVTRKEYDFAVAIEMIHTYSLIHDDLPAMDNDDLRRGIPTNHKVYGEDIAILAGDGLLNLAYETMINCALLAENETRNQYLRAMQIMSSASGAYGMIGGQVVDIKSQREDMDINTLEFIHENKTSKLIEASLVAGAIVGGAGEKDIQFISNYGKSIGKLFQIRDDILDRIGSKESLGKTAGIDDRNDKLTYVSLYGLEEAINISKELAEKIKSDCKNIEMNTEFFSEFIDYMVNREN